MSELVGIVLGAGSSRRLGRPKQTLAFGGRSLLAHVVRDVEASSLARIFVVLGGGSTEAESSLDLHRAQVIHNDSYGTGCASSLLAGLDAAGDCEGIMMLLGDMPGVTADVIDSAAGMWAQHRSWAAVSQYDDTRLGHPFIFSAAAFETLRGLHGDKAVWKIVDREPESRVPRLPIARPLPRDIDTWDDYVEVHARFGFDPAEMTPPPFEAQASDGE